MTSAALGIGALPDWLRGVSIRISPVPTSLTESSTSGVLWMAAPGRFLVEVPDVARFLVESGQSITIDPTGSAPEDEVARFARTTPFAALCHQRGISVFHAAAAARGDRAVLLAGDSAMGKSTVLAALLARGWRMLADDLTPVTLNDESVPVVLPTFPELILWDDAVDRLEPAGPAQTRLPPPVRARPNGTWSLPTDTLMARSPVRLGAVWRLVTHNRSRVEAEMTTGTHGFGLLSSLAYQSRVAAALLDPAIRWRVDNAIVANCELRVLRRPRGGWCVDEMSELIAAT